TIIPKKTCVFLEKILTNGNLLFVEAHYLPIMTHCATSAYYNDELAPTTSGPIDPDYAVSIEVFTPGVLHVAKYAVQQHLCAYDGKFNSVKSSVTAKANDKFVVCP